MYRSYSLQRMFSNQSWAPLSLLNHNVLPPPTHYYQLTRIAQQPKIHCTVRKPDETSECLRCLRYDLLRRRRTVISVPQTSEIKKYLSFVSLQCPDSELISSYRTFDGYVESEVILPVVALLNGLRRSLQYPDLKYQVKLDCKGKLWSSAVVFRTMTLCHSGSDSLAITEVQVFGDFAPETLKFPLVLFFVGLVIYYSPSYRCFFAAISFLSTGCGRRADLTADISFA
jgi:hypothetical protein